MMPGMNGTKQILWLLPLLMISLIRPIHQAFVPSRFFELYTTGNWVRSSFLYIFTWLALSFALVNPPLADIAAPHLAGAIDIATTEGISDSDLDGSVYEIRISQDSIPVLLGLAVRDNVDAENSTMNLTIQKVGQMGPIVNVSGLVSEIASDGSNGLSPSDTFESVDDEEWVRGLRKNSLTGGFLGPKVAPHPQDISMAWDLCPSGCGPGDYLIQISLTEINDMVPWQDGENTWQREYTLRILQSS